jgi:hypothetical protein
MNDKLEKGQDLLIKGGVVNFMRIHWREAIGFMGKTWRLNMAEILNLITIQHNITWMNSHETVTGEDWRINPLMSSRNE